MYTMVKDFVNIVECVSCDGRMNAVLQVPGEHFSEPIRRERRRRRSKGRLDFKCRESIYSSNIAVPAA